ncbi:DUF5667 domain-containing protein [Patescibacteria group bacterium]
MKKMEIDNLEKLGKAIKGLKKPALDVVKKTHIKESILTSIEKGHKTQLYPSLQKLKLLISKIAGTTKPNSVFRAKLKETIYAFAKQKAPSLAWQWQKVFASVLVAVITLSIATVYVSDIPITKAATYTTLVEITGHVNIVREGEVIEAEEHMLLQQGDIIVTGPQSTAIIRYIDDSVSRLSPSSELKIIKLFQDQVNASKTEVEIELTQGRVWNQVVNIVGDESSFQVDTNEMTANVSAKASFDISADESYETKVSVFENKVEVSLVDEKHETVQLVLEGYALETDHKESQIEKITINSGDDADWVASNIEKDKAYKKEVEEEDIEASKNEAGLTSENPFYTAKKINESTKLLLTTDTEDNAKLKIDIAITRLNEATVYINSDKSRDADLLLKEFNALVQEVSDAIRSSDEVKQYFENALAEEVKDLTVVMPDSSLYIVKEAVREAKIITATNDQEKKGVLLDEAEDKLIEAKELIKDEKQDIAEITLIEVQEEVIDVTYDDVDSEEEGVIEEHEEVISAAKVLIEVVEEEESNDEIARLAEVTHDLLENDIEDAFMNPELANDVINDKVEEYIYEKPNPVVSDSAVILDL